jgi:hypothetical protein
MRISIAIVSVLASAALAVTEDELMTSRYGKRS